MAKEQLERTKELGEDEQGNNPASDTIQVAVQYNADDILSGKDLRAIEMHWSVE